MAYETPECSQKHTQSRCHIKKKRQKIQELQPVEYVDLIQPKEEKDSSDNEEATKNKKHKFFVKKLHVKSRRFPRHNNQIQINPIIKDLIINKEEDAAKFKDDRKDNWANDFFKENNQLKNDSVGNQSKN